MGHCEDELVAPFPNSVNRSLPRPTTRLKCLCNALGFVLRGVFCQKMYLPPTHPRGHWPSSWPNPGVGLLSTPPPRLLYRFDTMPSSSSSPFRTSLLVYHLRPLSPNVCWHIRIIDCIQPSMLYCKKRDGRTVEGDKAYRTQQRAGDGGSSAQREIG